MASASPTAEMTASQMEEDGGKTEADQKDKKRKFRPLEKMRNFFRSTKKSSKSKERGSSIKAKSTGALHHETGHSEDDDDGGFSPPPLTGGTRSISEDSVFKPEQKESTLEPLRPIAVSMEHVSQDFRSELFSKLKRRTASQSDDDDGLPHSPPTHGLTMADLILGEGLKPSYTGKSASRESDKSLISTDLSENEEEDLFSSNWQSSVAAIKKPNKMSKASSSDMDLDLTLVKRDMQTLTSDAAKHRISIKPKARKSSMIQSRRKRERTTATPPLPSLNEDVNTPVPNISIQDNKTSIQVTAQPQKKDEITDHSEPVKDISKEHVKNLSKLVTPDVPTSITADTPVSKQVTKIDTPVSKQVTKTDTPVLKQVTKTVVTSRTVPEKHETPEKDSMQRSGIVVSSEPKEEVKLRKPRPKSLVEGLGDSVKSLDKDTESELSQAFNKVKRMSLRKDFASLDSSPKSEPIVPLKEVKEIVIETPKSIEPHSIPASLNVDKTKQAADIKSPTSTKESLTSPSTKTTYVLKKEPLRSPATAKVSPDYENVEELRKNILSPTSDYANMPPGGLKSELSSPEPDYDNMPPRLYPSSPEEDKHLPKEVEIFSKKDTKATIVQITSPNKLSSPKEEYRLKRQSRSKTLPEQPVPRELFDSKSTTNDSEKFSKNITPKTDSFKENNSGIQNKFSRSFTVSSTTGSEKSSNNKIGVESATKKQEPGRLSVTSKFESNTPSQSAWIKRKQEQDEKNTAEDQRPSLVKSNSSEKETEKPKFGQLKHVSVSSTREKEVGIVKKSTEVKKDTQVTNKPPLKAKPTDVLKPKTSDPAKPKTSDVVKPKPVESSSTKPTEIGKVSTLERKNAFENTSASQSNSVPAWKASLRKGSIKDKEVKIEIIEKSQPSQTTTPKAASKPMEKKPTPQLRNPVTACIDESKTSRKSSVLDMVKNYQKMEVT